MSAKQVLAECKRRGLLVKEIAGGSSSQYPGSRHWHIRRPEGSGTLELTQFGDRVWLKLRRTVTAAGPRRSPGSWP